MDLGMTGYQLIMQPALDFDGASVDAQVDHQVDVEMAAADLYEYVVPVHCEVVAFGAVITEDFAAQATDPVVSLKKSVTVNGTETVLKALTLGSSNTTLVRGDGARSNTAATPPRDNRVAIAADADLDTGDVVYADLDTLATGQPLLNMHFWPGEVIIFEHTTAATGAGGAYIPFAIVKFSGPDYTQDNTWRELRAGETAVG